MQMMPKKKKPFKRIGAWQAGREWQQWHAKAQAYSVFATV